MVLENLRHVFLQKYLKNKELNHFYISIILKNFGISLISIFIPIYLYALGYLIHQIVFFYFLWSFYFLIVSYTGTKIISKIGVKHSILLSTFFLIIYYMGFSFLEDFGFLFYILPLAYAIFSILYWGGYHLLFFTKSDKKIRGRELSLTYILTFLSMALAPFLGGLIAKETFTFLFGIGSFLILISSIPLFLTKETYFPKHFGLKSLFKSFLSKKERGNVISFSGYAIESVLQGIIWPIYLILILKTYVKTGLLVSLTTFISLIGLYISGILSDKYNKIKLIKLWSILHSLGWIARIFATSTQKIFLIDSYKNTAAKLLYVSWGAQIYDLADKRDYFRFIVFEHFTFHLARVLILPLIIFIFFIDYYPFAISFIIAAIFSLFYGFMNKK